MQEYLVGENVLVESESGSLLWDGRIKEQLTRPKAGSSGDIITGYKVEYLEWGKRFSDVVKPARVVEPNDNNRLLQVRPKHNVKYCSYNGIGGKV